ncbi:hypothetical protein KKC1_19050, partial [Calderihabitans maritimus]
MSSNITDIFLIIVAFLNCVFRSNWIPIPVQTGRLVRFKLDAR